MAKTDRIISFILSGPLLSLDTRSERHDRGGTIRGRGGPSMAAIFGPRGPYILLRTVRGDQFWGGTIHGVTYPLDNYFEDLSTWTDDRMLGSPLDMHNGPQWPPDKSKTRMPPWTEIVNPIVTPWTKNKILVTPWTEIKSFNDLDRVEI